jgi:micrococcal nuclease
MQYNAKAPYIVELHWKIDEVLDGDSFLVSHFYTKIQKEIRLYGLDAPEVHINRKMKEDEQKSQLPAQLLKQFGLMSLNFVLEHAPPQTSITIITEENHFYDYWNRQLAYIILPNGLCLNEIILENGFAKATPEYYCYMLSDYQILNRNAQLSKKGIYSEINRF